jgi:hypothetical protein
MPVVLGPETWQEWLGEEPADACQLKAMLAPYPDVGAFLASQPCLRGRSTCEGPGSSLTPRWRKPDSNFSSLSGSVPLRAGGTMGGNHMARPREFLRGGTNSSNPSPSSSESGELPAPSAEPPMGRICHRSPWRAPGEFLRAGTNSSNPSPSSGESATNSLPVAGAREIKAFCVGCVSSRRTTPGAAAANRRSLDHRASPSFGSFPALYFVPYLPQ